MKMERFFWVLWLLWGDCVVHVVCSCLCSMPKMIEMPHFTVLWLFGFHALLAFCLGACSVKLHFDLIEKSVGV